MFSGIGGFAVAAKEVWGEEYECIGFCDNNWFCQHVLRKNFPGVPVYDDIRTITEPQGDVGIITGGFPCQPFSAAGRRRGTSDDRYLWPEMFRVIQLTQPAWVIAENVSGLITWNEGMVLEQVCSDLENEGYEVQPFIIPAVALNAPHRRDRVWIVAHRTGAGLERRGQQGSGQHRQSDRVRQFERTTWSQDWPEVAAEFCRMDDGLSGRMVQLPDGTALSYPKWRKEALKAYGNAIVPQVAMQIMQAIKSCQ